MFLPMENFRFKAIEISLQRTAGRKPELTKARISDYYGEMTFNLPMMRQYMSEEAYEAVLNAIEKGGRIDRRIADQVATGMKAWAINKGATHYTHWFHPLTGATAEKHDAFIKTTGTGTAIEEFHGNELVQAEPDASSFPSGGIRDTFEARGYTAWDPTSPAFILDSTLCIPTIFVSYTGEALDYKAPLLKALNALDKASVEVCQYFDKDVNKVVATLGWEQEYFLVDSALYAARPDLVLAGRTLFGHASAKDQQLSDHYFGSIHERVINFMRELEYEAHRLGIPLKTRHNEVAPNQFECAPIFEEANLAVDHNQLLMHLLKKVGSHHDLTVLLHEKPFASVNGSGKHNNWSLQTNTGSNLLSPGKNPKNNLRFLVFLVNILQAVHTHAELLRAGIASAGNDLRLGANEAPPAIISAFIGTYLTQVLDEIEKKVKKGKLSENPEAELNLDIPKIPEILRDNTDRNRTSPFAFTGNKFEFRAVGSSDTCARAMIILNTILADQLLIFKKDVDQLIDSKVRKDEAIFQVLKKYIASSKKVRFEGNSYSEEWIKEAESRGLANIKSTPQAMKAYISAKTIKVFTNHKVFTSRELHARYEIQLENYGKRMQIESRLIGDLAKNHIIPTAIRYQNTLIENATGLKEVLDSKSYVKHSKNQVDTIKEISDHISIIKINVDMMLEERKKANRKGSVEENAVAYNEKVRPYFDIIRYHVDKLELLVDDELWPLPKYREILFLK
jgi:glutamine synthetase